jgi:hypothetical protein
MKGDDSRLLDDAASMAERMVMYGELQRVGEEAIVTYFTR